MTVTGGQLAAYAGALAVLVATPGPVVAALIARAATGGVRAAVPLAAGVAVGDVAWPLAAMLGIGVVSGAWGGFLTVLRYARRGDPGLDGWSLVRKAGALARGDAAGRRGSAAGRVRGRADGDRGEPEGDPVLRGGAAGVLRLPDADRLDVAVICLVSAAVPFLCNLAWAALFARARRWLADPVAMRRVHVGPGLALVAVGVAIAVG